MSRRKQTTPRLLSSDDDSSDVTSTGADCADSMLAKRRRSLGDDLGSCGSEKKLKGIDKLQHSDAESNDCDTVSQSSLPPSLINGRRLDADQLSTDEGDLIVDLDDEDYEERRTPAEVDSNQKIPDGSKSQRVFPYGNLNMMHSSSESESLQAIMAKAQLNGKTGEGRDAAEAGLPTADLVFLQTMLCSLQQQQFAQLQLIQHIQHQLLANGQSQSQLALSSATSSSILSSSSTLSSYYSPQRHVEHFPENKLAPADNRSTIEPSRHDNSYMAMDSGESKTCTAEAASPSSVVDLQQQHLHSSPASIPPHVIHIPAQPLVSTSFQPRTVPSLLPTRHVLPGQQQEVSTAGEMQVMETLPSIAGPATETTTSMLEQLVRNMEAKLPDSNQCVVCQRMLSCRSALQMHYRTHTGERPYHCKLCGRMFTTKGNLKTHMSVHLHYCPVCHKQFINDGTLHQHDSMHASCAAVDQHGLSQEPKTVSTSASLPSLSVSFPAAPPSLATSSVMQHPYGRIAHPFLLPSQPLPLVRSPVDQLYSGFSSASATDGECKELDLRVHKQPQPDDYDDQNKKAEDSQDDSSTQALPPLEQMENIVRRTQAEDLALTSARRLQPPVGLATVISLQDTAIENMTFAAASSGDRADILLPGNHGGNVNDRVCLDNYNTATVPSASSAFVPFSKAPVISDVSNHVMSNVMEASKSSRAHVTCSVCMKVFACRSALDIHYRSHTKERPYQCHVCQRAFSTRGNMKQHLLTHKTSRMSSKDVCQQQEGYHLIADSPTPLLPSSSRLSALRSDVGTPPSDRIEPPSGARPHAAVEIDNDSSASAASSAPSPVPHALEKVIDAGTSLVSSKNHVTTSTPSKPSSLSTLSASSLSSGRRVAQKHTCQVCEKPFSSASALQIHMRTHTGDKPFACTVCSKSFTTKGNLKVHMSTHKWFTRPSRRGRRSSIDLDNLGQGQSQQDYFGAFPRATRPLLGADGRFFPFLPPPAPGFSPFARGDAGIGSSVFRPHANIPISMTPVGMLGLSRLPNFTRQLDGSRICSSPNRRETEVLSPRRETGVSYFQRELDNSRVPVALTTNRQSSQSPQSPVTAQSSDCDSGHYSPSTVHSGSSGELDLSMKKRRSSSPSIPGALAGDAPSSISSSANSSRSSSADDGKGNVTSPYQPPNLMHFRHTWQL